MSFNNVGKVWTPDSFGEYLSTIKPPSWAKGVCLHHTSSPSLAQRPNGFTIQHIINIRSFYQGLGWNRGPHFFTDEDQIFGMTPPNIQGIHAVPFNSTHIGIEALGHYSRGGENPKSGRGLQVWQNTAAATRALLDWMRLPANEQTVVFHREGRTTKDCPGSQIDKAWILELVRVGEKKQEPEEKPLFAPVAATLRAKGFTDQQIQKNLRREGKMFFWLDDQLEFAYYDSKLGATMAPVSELENIKP
jgi:hypothetical protein